jgi:hypothetical protein
VVPALHRDTYRDCATAVRLPLLRVLWNLYLNMSDVCRNGNTCAPAGTTIRTIAFSTDGTPAPYGLNFVQFLQFTNLMK